MLHFRTRLLLACLLVTLVAGTAHAGPADEILATAGVGEFTQISTGRAHSCAVSSERRLFCWGHNGYGQLGDGTNTNRHTPVEVVPGDGLLAGSVAEVAVGYDSTCARSVYGRVYCWGINDTGQLGDGTTTNRSVPTEVKAGAGLVQGSVAQVDVYWLHACARNTSGQVFCWGLNDSGQLGDGTLTNSTVPVLVTPVTGFAAAVDLAVGGFFTCALSTDSFMYCWGDSQYGQTGSGSSWSTSTPTRVVMPFVAAPATSIKAGSTSACALTSMGEVYCWGANHRYQLGSSGGNAYQPRPVQNFPAGTVVSSISEGSLSFCAVTADRSAYCWGYGMYGQLGGGWTGDSYDPVEVAEGDGFKAGQVGTLAAGLEHTCGLDLAGKAFCWGNNTSGQIGDGTSTQRLTPRAVASLGLPTCDNSANRVVLTEPEAGQVGDPSQPATHAAYWIDVHQVGSEVVVCVEVLQGGQVLLDRDFVVPPSQPVPLPPEVVQVDPDAPPSDDPTSPCTENVFRRDSSPQVVVRKSATGADPAALCIDVADVHVWVTTS